MTGLLFVIAFFLAIDEKSLTGVFARPLVAGTLTGALLGNTEAGMAAGMTLEFYAMAADRGYFGPTGISFVLPAVAGTALAVQYGLNLSSTGVLAAILTALSTAVSALAGTLNMTLLPMARKAAEKHAAGTLGVYNLLGMLIRGCLFGAAAVLIWNVGASAEETLSQFVYERSWLSGSLRAVSGMIPAVGFAVLLRNLSVKEIPGALFAGIAAGLVFASLEMHAAGFAAAGCAGFAMAAFSMTKKAEPVKEIKTEKKTVKGGDEEWW